MAYREKYKKLSWAWFLFKLRLFKRIVMFWRYKKVERAGYVPKAYLKGLK